MKDSRGVGVGRNSVTPLTKTQDQVPDPRYQNYDRIIKQGSQLGKDFMRLAEAVRDKDYYETLGRVQKDSRNQRIAEKALKEAEAKQEKLNNRMRKNYLRSEERAYEAQYKQHAVDREELAYGSDTYKAVTERQRKEGNDLINSSDLSDEQKQIERDTLKYKYDELDSKNQLQATANLALHSEQAEQQSVIVKKQVVYDAYANKEITAEEKNEQIRAITAEETDLQMREELEEVDRINNAVAEMTRDAVAEDLPLDPTEQYKQQKEIEGHLKANRITPEHALKMTEQAQAKSRRRRDKKIINTSLIPSFRSVGKFSGVNSRGEPADFRDYVDSLERFFADNNIKVGSKQFNSIMNILVEDYTLANVVNIKSATGDGSTATDKETKDRFRQYQSNMNNNVNHYEIEDYISVEDATRKLPKDEQLLIRQSPYGGRTFLGSKIDKVKALNVTKTEVQSEERINGVLGEEPSRTLIAKKEKLAKDEEDVASWQKQTPITARPSDRYRQTSVTQQI